MRMKVCFIGVWYYEGPVRHLFQIHKIYNRIARVFEAAGIECYHFSKQSEILPKEKCITEEQFYKMLPEIDCVFMWNGGLGKEIEIAEKCRIQGTPVYFSELGWFPQMNTFYFDTKGVNYGSTLTEWKFDGKQLSEQDSLFLNANLSYYHNIVAKKPTIELPKEDFVFVPFQVESDSQLINYSPHIKKMQELIDYMEHFISGKVIFKRHPKDDPGELKYPDRFIVTSEGSTHDYLPHCKYCVTINSTVGLEALTYMKPVITLGQAFYGGRGLTYEVNNEQDMYKAIQQCESGTVARGIVCSFLCHLFKKQWHIVELKNADKVMSLIYELTQ